MAWVVLASAAGERIGFGLAGIAGAGVLWSINQGRGLLILLLVGAGGILAGAVAGSATGMAQWLVLRRSLHLVSWPAWVLVTTAGAEIAWGCGMVLSASVLVIGFRPASDTLLIVAALLGLLPGALPGCAQWLVLRRYLQDAAWWILGNILAWMLGLVIAFTGVGMIPAESSLASIILLVAVTGMLVGAMTGTITGLALLHSCFLALGRGVRSFNSSSQRAKLPLCAASNPGLALANYQEGLVIGGGFPWQNKDSTNATATTQEYPRGITTLRKVRR